MPAPEHRDDATGTDRPFWLCPEARHVVPGGDGVRSCPCGVVTRIPPSPVTARPYRITDGRRHF